MLRKLAPLLLAFSCQQNPGEFDTDVVNLVRGPPEPVALAPIQVTTTNIAPPPPPALAATLVVKNRIAKHSARETLSVSFYVDVIGANGGDLALELVTPDGTVYQRMLQDLGTDPFATQHFEFKLPVAGTWIQSQGLTGTWDAHLFRADAELVHETFELDP